MAFPLSPIDGQQYTNTSGTEYQYDSTKSVWNIVSQSVMGNQAKVTLSLEYPSSSERVPFYYTPVPVTLTKLSAAIIGTGSPAVYIHPYFTSSLGTDQTAVLDSTSKINSVTTMQNFTNFTTTSVPANSYFIFDTTRVDGTVTNIIQTLEFIA